MSFKDKQYFKKFVEEEINHFMSNPTKNFCEARIRSIVSRAYYTMFLHCRDEIGLGTNKTQNVHRDVQDRLKEHHKKQLANFHNARKEMDYNNINVKNGNKLVSELNSLKRNMNNFLELDKSKLEQ